MSRRARFDCNPRPRFYSRNSDTWKKFELAQCMDATGIPQSSMDIKRNMLAELVEHQQSNRGLTRKESEQILAIRRESRRRRREKDYARRARAAGIGRVPPSLGTYTAGGQRRSVSGVPTGNLRRPARNTHTPGRCSSKAKLDALTKVDSKASPRLGSPGSAEPDLSHDADDSLSDNERLGLRCASFTCSSCGGSNVYFSFNRWTITDSCTHKRDVCRSCIQNHLTARYESFGWDQLNCPTCKNPFSSADVRRWAPEPLYQRYKTFELQRGYETGGANYVRCPLQHKDGTQCDGAGDCDPRYQSFVDCESCGGRYCLECRVEWHAGISCEEIQRQRAEEQQQREEEQNLSAMYVEKECKRCPNEGCGVPIQKSDGCSHMTCAHCNHEFCWECLADYGHIKNEGNERHADNCPYHSDNLPGALQDRLIHEEYEWEEL